MWSLWGPDRGEVQGAHLDVPEDSEKGGKNALQVGTWD